YGDDYSIPSLASGETYTVEHEVSSFQARNYINTVTVDYYDAIEESDESNNIETYSYSVSCTSDDDCSPQEESCVGSGRCSDTWVCDSGSCEEA
ncbi:MAG: CARDB domain-containing protein, partial [Nanoarchaeota archaeon]